MSTQTIRLKDLTIYVTYLEQTKGAKDPAVVHIREVTPDGKEVEFKMYQSEVNMMLRVLQGWM